jgi:hypothetical protein
MVSIRIWIPSLPQFVNTDPGSRLNADYADLDPDQHLSSNNMVEFLHFCFFLSTVGNRNQNITTGGRAKIMSESQFYLGYIFSQLCWCWTGSGSHSPCGSGFGSKRLNPCQSGSKTIRNAGNEHMRVGFAIGKSLGYRYRNKKTFLA